MEIEVEGFGIIIDEHFDRNCYIEECFHKDIDYGDDDERGVCTYCGQECDWGWIGVFDDELGKIPVREPREWYEKDQKGVLWGIIAAYKAGEFEDFLGGGETMWQDYHLIFTPICEKI